MRRWFACDGLGLSLGRSVGCFNVWIRAVLAEMCVFDQCTFGSVFPIGIVLIFISSSSLTFIVKQGKLRVHPVLSHRNEHEWHRLCCLTEKRQSRRDGT